MPFRALLLLLILVSNLRADTLGKSCIVADPDDHYYQLAEEIAAQYTIPVYYTIHAAQERNCNSILWIASPDYLRLTHLRSVGLELGKGSRITAVGIITGSSLDKARALWQRGGFLRSAPVCEIENDRIIMNDEIIQITNKSDILNAIAGSAVITQRGHGAGNLWMHGDDVRISNEDLPALPANPAIISGGCQTFKPWLKNSLAMASTDSGAAHYAGFMFSPIPNYLFGFGQRNLFKNTSPEFPVGLVVALQNKAAKTGYMRFYYYCMLGDPRSYMNQEDIKPLRIEEHGTSETIYYDDIPAGIVPLKIKGGSKYTHMTVPGYACIDEKDRIYSSRLVSGNIGKDKYILLDHPGGELRITLETGMQGYGIINTLKAAFEYCFGYLPDTNGQQFTALLGLILLVIPFAPLINGNGKVADLAVPGMGAGLIGLIEALMCYVMAGALKYQSVVSSFGWIWNMANTALLFTGIYLGLKKSVLFKVLGLVVGLLPFWGPALMWGGSIVALNMAAEKLYFGPIYTYHIPLYLVLVLSIQFLLVLTVIVYGTTRVKSSPPLASFNNTGESGSD